MNDYERFIDPTDFHTVANYLHNPRSPIECVLHVSSRDALAALAGELERALQSGAEAPAAVRGLVRHHLDAGTVRISSRWPLAGHDPRHVVDVASVPGTAGCEVIFMPPFYLAHTPGLFEGKLQTKKSVPKRNRRTRAKQEKALRMTY